MNTVCVAAGKISTDCPIIDIQLLTDTTGFENYTQVPYADVTLAYTRDLVDSSPITSTRVGPYACLDPKEYDNGA